MRCSSKASRPASPTGWASWRMSSAAESADLGLRVFVGQQVAFVSSTDFSERALAALPDRAVAMAKLAPEDKFAGLAPTDRLATSRFPHSTSKTRDEPSAETLIERARAVEGAAMAVTGVTNSEGGGASFAAQRHRARHQRRLFRRAMPAPATASASRCWPAKAPAWSATMTSASARHAGDLRKRRRRRQARRRTRGQAAESAQGEIAERAGGLRSARSRRACSAISPARFPAPPSRAASAS